MNGLCVRVVAVQSTRRSCVCDMFLNVCEKEWDWCGMYCGVAPLLCWRRVFCVNERETDMCVLAYTNMHLREVLLCCCVEELFEILLCVL